MSAITAGLGPCEILGLRYFVKVTLGTLEQLVSTGSWSIREIELSVLAA